MKPFPTYLDSLEEFKKIFEDVDYILTDLDGCLWLHNTIVPGADKFINNMKKLGKKIIFATNNSSKSRRIIKEKLNNLGIGPDQLPYDLQDFGLIKLDPDVQAVILGFDYWLSYPKLIKTCSYAKKISEATPDLFIATNLDETLPTGYKHLCIPGTGALVRTIITAVGKEPVVLGKPSPWFFDCIKTINPDIKPEKCLMIGDRLNSDIEFANNNCFKYSLFVQGGVSSLKEIEESVKNGRDKLVPTHYCTNLGELNKFLDTYFKN